MHIGPLARPAEPHRIGEDIGHRGRPAQRVGQGRAAPVQLRPVVEGQVRLAADHLFGGPAEQALGAAVEDLDAALGVRGDDADLRRGVEHRIQQRHRAAQGPVGLVAGGDVAADGVEAAHRAAGVDVGDELGLDVRALPGRLVQFLESVVLRLTVEHRGDVGLHRRRQGLPGQLDPGVADDLLARPAEAHAVRRVHEAQAQRAVHIGDAQRHLVGDVVQEALALLGLHAGPVDLGLQPLARGDVGADGDEAVHQPVRTGDRRDHRVHPVQAAVAGAVADLAAPGPAAADRLPHAEPEVARMAAGIDDPVVLADQRLAGVLGDAAEVRVGVEDEARAVGDRHQCVGVDRVQEGLALAQRRGKPGLVEGLLGDVLEHEVVADHLAIAQIGQQFDLRMPQRVLVRRAQAAFEDAFAARQRRRHAASELRMQRLEQVGAAQPRVRSQRCAELAVPGQVAAHQHGRGIPVGDQGRHGVQGALHIGQRGLECDGALLQRRSELLDGPLGLLRRPDVAHRQRQSGEHAAQVAQRHDQHRHVDQPAGAVQPLGVERGQRFAAGGTHQEMLRLGQMRSRHQPLQRRLPDDLVRGVAEQRLGALVPVEHRAVRIDHHHGIAAGLQGHGAALALDTQVARMVFGAQVGQQHPGQQQRHQHPAQPHPARIELRLAGEQRRRRLQRDPPGAAGHGRVQPGLRRVVRPGGA